MKRTIIYGVSPEFAMTKMDDVPQYECDLYVEDRRAATMLTEILAAHSPDLVQRCQVIPYGAASVGMSLGIMASQERFPRPSCVFLDGDQAPATGCIILPGEDAPEQVIFRDLLKNNWANVAVRVGRPFSQVADDCTQAMTLANHHDWVKQAATQLVVSGEILWHAMCAEWSTTCFSADEAKFITQAINDVLIGIKAKDAIPVTPEIADPPKADEPSPAPSEPIVSGLLFELSPSGPVS